ncbi:LAFE_0E09098g1_1 [Lachancea fermentati]|uniref:Signal recognition particle subunit SRP14 n=1 Tax=Lachancea fermentati TaxID=4955 RepID=A0A1G4MDK0_LACFM|nr:LAFE_0E09098g1_1 [Lachancea fermentati]
MSESAHIPAPEFLAKVSEMFATANRAHRTVHLSIKRLVDRDPVEGTSEFDATEKPLYDVSRKSQFTKVPEDASTKQYPLLVRISCLSGIAKQKHSTVVEADDLDKFWKDYSAAIKTGMVGLVKKKKKKAKKSLRK